MKNKASIFLKQIMSVLSSLAKAKSMAIKSKTSAIKARLLVFSLMKKKKILMGSISNKIHAILGQHDKESDEDNNNGDLTKAIVLYNRMEISSRSRDTQMEDNFDEHENNDYDYDDDDDKYPDLRHSLFDEEDDFEDPGGSIIDLVKNSKEVGEDFSLEDEIDHVADLFIMRFHKQMRLQKMESFKRYQEMMQRSV